MPTPSDFHTVLRHLATHLHHLQTEIWETRYHAARTSQTGTRHTTTGPTSPTNDTQLDYLLDTQTRLRELATNASEDLHILIPHNTQVGNYWSAWFYRHRAKLQNLTWYTDLEAELTDLETELRHHIHPQDPHDVKLPDYATADEIGRALGKTPDAIRKWCKRHHVTAYIENGTTKYRTKEITQT